MQPLSSIKCLTDFFVNHIGEQVKTQHMNGLEWLVVFN